MFVELMPIIRQRNVLLTISLLQGDTIRTTFVPQNRNKNCRLPTVAEVYPEIIDSDEEDHREPACSAAEALTRQEPFINQNLAYEALAMLTQLLRHGSLRYRGGFCNLIRGQVVAIAIATKAVQK